MEAQFSGEKNRQHIYKNVEKKNNKKTNKKGKKQNKTITGK